MYPRNVFVTYVRTTINLKNLIGIYAAGISIGTYNIKIFLYNMSVECIVFIIIYIGRYLLNLPSPIYVNTNFIL